MAAAGRLPHAAEAAEPRRLATGGLGAPHKNVLYNGSQYNMGGCMGCHGSQGQLQSGDFSVIVANGAVNLPEYPATLTPTGASAVPRNRLLKISQ